MIGLALLLLLGAPDGAATESWREIAALAERAPAEPEPPAGLRAPKGTERHERARRTYAARLEAWEGARKKHAETLLRRCVRHRQRHREFEREVRNVEAGAYFELGRYAEARALWIGLLKGGLKVKPQLVAVCRAMGDYEAALRYGKPTPEALEEAGQIGRAIAAATAAGQARRAEEWRMIGKPFPFLGKIPQLNGPAVVLAKNSLPDAVQKALMSAFDGKIHIFPFSDGQKAIYLLDSSGTVKAVNPRLDTLHHRISHLLARR